jgi:hypothetical protein
MQAAKQAVEWPLHHVPSDGMAASVLISRQRCIQAAKQAVERPLHHVLSDGMAAGVLRNFLRQCAPPKDKGRQHKKHTMIGQSLGECFNQVRWPHLCLLQLA